MQSQGPVDDDGRHDDDDDDNDDDGERPKMDTGGGEVSSQSRSMLST